MYMERALKIAAGDGATAVACVCKACASITEPVEKQHC